MAASTPHSLRYPLAGLVLLGVVVAEGLFASGILAVIQLAASPWASGIYAAYFAGLVAGQLVIARVARASAYRYAYPTYVALFGLAIWGMGRGLLLGPLALVPGRGLEGLAAGLALPLGFGIVLNLPVWGGVARRLALFNSLMALGFVSGPLLVGWLLVHLSPATLLSATGLAFVGVAALLAGVLPPTAPEAPSPARWRAELQSPGTYALFLAKSYYGYFLPALATRLLAYMAPLTLGQAMIGFAGLFVVGQAIAAPLARRVPIPHLQVYVPLTLTGVLLYMWAWPGAGGPCVAALVHAVLLHLGYLGDDAKPRGPRAFARTNVLSDPGLLGGALLAGLGPDGLLLIAGLGLVPLLRFVAAPAGGVRAEHFHPFVGPLTLFKLPAKHRQPVRSNVDWPKDEAALTFRYAAEACGGATLTLALCGDWAPVSEPPAWAPPLRERLLAHDLRLVNLEGARATDQYHARRAALVHDMPLAQFARLQGVGKPAFNVLACSNNHVLDAGYAAYEATLANLSADGLLAVTAELQVLEVRGVKVGFFACTFGSNMLWRRHRQVRVLHPERVAADADCQRALAEQLAAYRARVDVLVMSYHWGYESEFWPSGCQAAAWRFLHEAGVDVLFGHHGHIVQPCEVGLDGAGICLYSCGNLAVDMPLPVYNQGALFSLTLEAPPTPGARWRVQHLETHFFARVDGLLVPLAQDQAEAFRRS